MKGIINLILFSSILFCSCREKYKLNIDDRRILPYSGKEMLVFESNKGDLDTVSLIGYKQYFVADKINVGEKYFYEHLDLMTINYYDSLETFCLALTATKDKGVYLSFNIVKRQRGYFFSNGVFVDSVRNAEMEEILVKDHLIHDVIKVENKNKNTNIDTAPVSENKSNIKQLYWSMSSGLIQYTLYDGEVWTIR